LLIKENEELKVLINYKFDMLIKDNKEKFDVLIKENKEMKAKINYLENLLNTNLGILTDASFEKIKDFYPRIIITNDTLNYSQNGIIHMNIIDFILSDII
jgi:hypothetical protein